jgi:hypothetical protein
MPMERLYFNLARRLLLEENGLTRKLACLDIYTYLNESEALIFNQLLVRQIFTRSRNGVRELLIEALDTQVACQISEKYPTLAPHPKLLWQNRLWLIDELNTLMISI